MSVVFFTDRDLGHQFPAILRDAGLSKYRATPPGFMKTEEVIEITGDNQRNCERPLFVTLVVSGECTPPSHISMVAPAVKKR